MALFILPAKNPLTFSFANKKILACYSKVCMQQYTKSLLQFNMKRLFTLALISTVFVSKTKSQIKYGVNAGVNFSNWQGDAVKSLNNIVDVTNGFISTKGKTGFHIGGYLTVPVSENFSVEPGIQYSQKGYTLVGDLKIDALKFLGVNACAKVQAHYIDIPVMLKATVATGLSIYAGPQVSFLAKNNLRLNAGILGISLLNSNLDITDNFNKIDFAVAGGAGYQFENGFNIKAGYDYGLSRLDKNDNFKAFNRVAKISVGLTF